MFSAKRYRGDSAIGRAMSKLRELVFNIAPQFSVDPDLVLAIIQVESNGNKWACRFEPGWKYHKDTIKWAKALLQSEETEKNQQSTSWGLMQVMGTVAREMGFTGHLPQLCLEPVGIRCGCLKLQSLFKKYESQDDVISAYNQGNARKDETGRYINQGYVDKVNAALRTIKAN